MKYALIAINSSYIHSSLSIYSIYSSSLHKQQIDTMEFNINQPIDLIIEELYSSDAEVYMFSAYIWNIEMILKITSDLKKIKECMIVLGGSEVAFNPNEYLNTYNQIDYIISGEGEAVIDRFIEAINNNRSPLDIPGIYDKNKAYDQNDIIKFNFHERIFPYDETILTNQLSNKIIYYESSRGCPFRCSYCISHLDKKLRYLSISRVKKELLFFMQHKVNQVKFVDRTFNSDAKRAYEIIQYILENNICTNFHFEICAELMTQELVDLLRNAPSGCFQIEVGLQSTNTDSLNAINRTNDLVKFKEIMSKILFNNNIHVHADLIALLPCETLETFKKGFDYLYDIGPHMIQLGSLKLLNGTDLKKDAELYGIRYSNYPPYEALSTETLSYADKKTLKAVTNIVDKYYNSGAFSETLQYLINTYYDSPFDFYHSFAIFFKKVVSDHRSISRKELYKILLEFIIFFSYDAVGTSLLVFDYLKNNTLHLPDFLQNVVASINQKNIFDFLNNSENIRLLFPEFLEVKPKDIVKKTKFIFFPIDPETCDSKKTLVAFSNKRDEDIQRRNMHKIIPENYHNFFV